MYSTSWIPLFIDAKKDGPCQGQTYYDLPTELTDQLH